MSERALEETIERYLLDHGYKRRGYPIEHRLDYSVDYALDIEMLLEFLRATQPQAVAALQLDTSEQRRQRFIERVVSEITARGVVDVLRGGVRDYGYPQGVVLFYLTPSAGNARAQEHFAANRFTVMRQVHYSAREPQKSIDMVLFINGIPVVTLELKNSITSQTTRDAVSQYCRDRDPRELLFHPGRVMVHFAVDDSTVEFCPQLLGEQSIFLPFNRGYNGGAGNPPNPDGLRTDYLWRETLSRERLTRIIESYALRLKGGRQIFPRYHQLDVVERLTADVVEHGVGRRYLVQHSAGSGKSNSIAWLAYRLIAIEQAGRPLIDSVLVVTDRVSLDRNIKDTVKSFMKVRGIVGWARDARSLAKALRAGQRIIITTVEKFPFALDKLSAELGDRHFAVIIDEAHSGQMGRNAAQMNMSISGMLPDGSDEEDCINALVEGRRFARNASYFAFTATPKNKTLELFGTRVETADGVEYQPFHVYTMRQAIEEGFILDVLSHYTTYHSYYRLVKTLADGDDPLFDAKKAKKLLRHKVESSEHPIAEKAAVMVRHLLEQVIGRGMINGQARAMVVTADRECCVKYYRAISRLLAERQSPYRAVIAFSGEYDEDGVSVTSAQLNGFPDSEVPDRLRSDPYRLLIVADMYQTGYDEPLLHTMYVDKKLTDVKAVQTLSRLNRTHPAKHDCLVLDFVNTEDDIRAAFARYYKTTLLVGETDPSRLYDFLYELAELEVYGESDVADLVSRYVKGAVRTYIDPILDACTERYLALELADRIKFKRTAKAFVRMYDFLAAMLPCGMPDWERQSIFLTLLLPKLPAPEEDDNLTGVLAAVDLECYRLEAGQRLSIALADEDAEVAPPPTNARAYVGETQLDPLSEIVSSLNELLGGIEWKDADNVRRQVLAIPEMMLKDEQYLDVLRNGDSENARDTSDAVLGRIISAIMSDNLELYKQYNSDDGGFRRALANLMYSMTREAQQRGEGTLADISRVPFMSDGLMVAEGRPSLH